MTLTELRKSLALWRSRYSYRRWRWLVARGMKNQARMVHWRGLMVEARDMVTRREQQIAEKTSGPRDKVVAVARQAAANYAKNPSAYHYLAGGVANNIILSPSPRNYRSDCSQFVVSCYKLAGVPCPGSGTYLYSNTVTIANGKGKVTTNPRPGDLAMYGSRSSPHHVEMVVGTNPLRYLGHGTQPFDGIVPGPPSYFLSFLD